MSQMETKSINSEEAFVKFSQKIPIKENQSYSVKTSVQGKKGLPYSGFFLVKIFNLQDQLMGRKIKWITDFSGSNKEYQISFISPKNVSSIQMGYLFNRETPVKSDIEISYVNLSDLKPLENNSKLEEYDDINKFEISRLPQLSSIEEDELENKMYWILSSGRSGSTWFARLLVHPSNVLWIEPFIGNHLGQLAATSVDPITKEHVSIRIFDRESKHPNYFFSPHHRNNWIPALRKFIITRGYSQSQDINKNLIIKDPTASLSGDIIFGCLPNSKLIYLVRDGHDVVDSQMDMHGENSWARLPPLLNKNHRIKQITKYCYDWIEIQKRNSELYDIMGPKNKLLVRYEDLRNNTFGELQKIYKFLNIMVKDQHLKETIEINDYEKIPPDQKGKGKFVRTAIIGGWKKNFDEGEQKIMNSIMNPTLEKLGYQSY